MSKQHDFTQSLSTLANATELASKVIHKVSGEEIANTVNGQVLGTTDVKEAVAAKIQGALLTGKGGNAQ